MKPSEMQLLTNSRRNSFNDCSRKHFLRYEQGYQPVKLGEALRFGSLWHGALEMWWKSPVEVRLIKSIDWLDRQKETDWNIYDIERARQMIIGYDKKWGTQDLVACRMEDGNPAVEVEYRAPLLNPETSGESRTFVLAGKIDAVAMRTSTGRKVLVEHKSTDEDLSPESDYWSILAIDGQISGYYVGAQAVGYDIDECIYDVARKPAQRPYKATPEADRKYTKAGTLYANQRASDETVAEYGARVAEVISADLDRYFSRRLVSRLEDDMTDYMYDMWAVGREIRESELCGRWPRNPPACKRYGLCEYFPVCSRLANIDDESLYTKLPHPFPELSTGNSVLGTVPEEETTTSPAEAA